MNNTQMLINALDEALPKDFPIELIQYIIPKYVELPWFKIIMNASGGFQSKQSQTIYFQARPIDYDYFMLRKFDDSLNGRHIMCVYINENDIDIINDLISNYGCRTRNHKKYKKSNGKEIIRIKGESFFPYLIKRKEETCNMIMQITKLGYCCIAKINDFINKHVEKCKVPNYYHSHITCDYDETMYA